MAVHCKLNTFQDILKLMFEVEDLSFKVLVWRMKREVKVEDAVLSRRFKAIPVVEVLCCTLKMNFEAENRG